MESAKVYYREALAGVIRLGENKVYEFSYEADYLKSSGPAISQTLPLQESPHVSDSLFPFFDGLIPEGWLLQVAEETWKINSSDRWKMLLTVCQDCVGAVKVIANES